MRRRACTDLCGERSANDRPYACPCDGNRTQSRLDYYLCQTLGQADSIEEGSVSSSKSGHKKLRIALVALVLLSVVDQSPQASSQPSRELEMTVHLDDTAQSQPKLPKFRVELRNVGDHDLILNLGFTLANGRKQYPNAIVLTIVDTQGKARQFDLIGPAGVAGRLDPLILPLPAGSTFSLPVDLDKYWAAASKEFQYKFQRGSYSIEAQFRGKTVSSQEANLDVKGIALMPYWTGTATSNQLRFEVNS